MKAFEKAKIMSPEQIFEKMDGLRESGMDRTPVVEKWKASYKERDFWPYPVRVIAALNNGDLNKKQLELLNAKTDEVFEGLLIAAKAAEAGEKMIYLPEGEDKLAAELKEKADAYDVRIEIGMADVRKNRGSIFHHFGTLIAVSEIIEGIYEPGTYMAVCSSGKTGELIRVKYGTRVSDILKECKIADTENLRAIAIGSRLYEAETAAGMTIDETTPVGNGIITIYPEDNCMVHETYENLKAYRQSSCGKCTFCREGLIQLTDLSREITDGQGQKDAVALMEEIGNAMTFSTQCTLGENASLFMLDAIQLFGDEFNEHIRKKKCAKNVCKAFSSIYIDPDECQGCEDCVDACPADAIEGKAGFIHMIDEYECTKCGKCIDACEYEAIIQTTGRVPKLPGRLVKVGKFRKH